MASKRAEIAQAVYDAIAADKLAGRYAPQEFQLTRQYYPNSQLTQDVYYVTVLPTATEDRVAFDRGRMQKTLSVPVGVRWFIPPGADADPQSISGNALGGDAFNNFCELLADSFDPVGGTNPRPSLTIADGDVRWVGTRIEPVYDLDNLATNRLFASQIVLSYFYL